MTHINEHMSCTACMPTCKQACFTDWLEKQYAKLMPIVSFTQNLRRHVDCPSTAVNGKTVRDALEAVFVSHEQLRGYVLDDQGRLRRHMLVAVDGVMVNDRVDLADPVEPDSEIYVIQALSGG